ncbi:MAG: peptide chain release factor 1 [Clostridia bacterium]|nr:peptide chain release factor 1 [Clostridia bacterium]
MFEKLGFLEEKFIELNEKASDPAIISDQEQFRNIMKEISELEPIVEKYREYKQAQQEMNDAKEMMDGEEDHDLREMAEAEYYDKRDQSEQIIEEIKILLLPKDENDEKNVIVEIRAGAGGDEAALFAGDLYRMYSMYAMNQRFKTEVISETEIGIGGYKEISFSIEGKGVYSKLKFESGVHRVQRIPETESGGRIHTSTVTVAVLPEVEDVEVEINPDDLEIDTYRASGAGGQHVNKTESAIRITHKPSGIVVACQNERSQHKNRDMAMKMLRSKLYDIKIMEQNSKIAAERKSQVGTGDRSERIRTYNYPQCRVTDHRIGLTIQQLPSIMNGNIDAFVEALITADRSAKLLMSEN